MLRRIAERRKPVAIAAALAATTLLTLTACGPSAADGGASGEGDNVLTFAAVPAESSSSLKSSFEPLIALIEEATGMTVEFQDATDYASVIEGQRAGKIDIASYGPFSYMIARDGGVPIEAVAAPVNDPSEVPAYTSLLYVPKDSTIQSINDLAGKTVCFVDAASTSGYLVPSEGLLSVGIDPATGVKPVMAGAHDASLLTTAGGQCEAGFAHDAMLSTLIAGNQIDADALRSVWESAPIPEDPLALNTETIPADVRAKITEALHTTANKPALVAAGICASEAECVLPEDTGWGYVAVTDADYDPIRRICEVTKAEACNV